MQGGWVYIMTNGPSGTLYVGMTADIARRVMQHRQESGSDFCRTHGLTQLVYFERHERVGEAIVREKAIKAWKRAWKLNLIARSNPEWRDLFEDLNG